METEESLALKYIFLEAVANSSADGILVVDHQGRKVFQNARTIELWKIPPEVAADPDGQRQVAHVMNMTRDPAKFVAEIERQIAHPLETNKDRLELVDGTVLDRHSAPVLGADGACFGRIYHFHDITELHRSEARIRALLEEKETILKETHHRVKNYLSSVTGLLSLQASSLRVGPVAEALKETEGRVKSMALLYDKLYVSSSFRSISAASFIPDLVREVAANVPCAAKVDASAKVEAVVLDAKTMRAVGILVNELVTNALKHAFAGRAEGRIEVGLARSGDDVLVTVADDGVGLSGGGGEPEGFGLALVAMLVAQLEGELSVERSGGTEYTLRFRP